MKNRRFLPLVDQVGLVHHLVVQGRNQVLLQVVQDLSQVVQVHHLVVVQVVLQVVQAHNQVVLQVAQAHPQAVQEHNQVVQVHH